MSPVGIHIAVDLCNTLINYAGCDVDCLLGDYIASFAPGSLTIDAEYTAPHQANIIARWQYISVWLRMHSLEQAVYIPLSAISRRPQGHIPLCSVVPMSGAVLCNVASTTCGATGDPPPPLPESLHFTVGGIQYIRKPQQGSPIPPPTNQWWYPPTGACTLVPHT